MATLENKFQELFGGSEDIVQGRVALQDVLPGSISVGSKYSTNELNKKRRSVTGRESRVGNIRSAYGPSERPATTTESPRQITPTMEDPRYTDLSARQGGTSPTPTSDTGGGGFGNAPAPDGGGPLSDAVVGQLLSGAGGTALLTGLGGLGMGFGLQDVLGPSIGAGLTSLTGLGALNTLGGGIYSHYAGEGVGEDFRAANPVDASTNAPAEMDVYNDAVREATEQAKLDAMSRGGLIGNLGRDLLAGLGTITGLYDVDTTKDLAQQGFTNEFNRQDFQLSQDPAYQASLQSREQLPGTMSVGSYDPNAISAPAATPGMMDRVGSYLSSAFTAPTQEDLKNFNFDSLTANTGAQVGASNATGNINEPGSPEAGALTDTQSDVTDATASGVIDTPASPQDTQPQGLQSSINAEAQAAAQQAQQQAAFDAAKATYEREVAAMNARNAAMSGKVRDQRGAAQLSAAGREALNTMNSIAGVSNTGLVSPSFGDASSQYGSAGWGTNYDAIQSDWDAINRQIAGGISRGGYDSFGDRVTRDFLGGGGGGYSTAG